MTMGTKVMVHGLKPNCVAEIGGNNEVRMNVKEKEACGEARDIVLG
jgi:hypothetical protein